MAYDQAVLDAFTTYETACRFRDFAAHTMTASPEYRMKARTLGFMMVERATKALREAINMGAEYEGIGTTPPHGEEKR